MLAWQELRAWWIVIVGAAVAGLVATGAVFASAPQDEGDFTFIGRNVLIDDVPAPDGSAIVAKAADGSVLGRGEIANGGGWHVHVPANVSQITFFVDGFKDHTPYDAGVDGDTGSVDLHAKTRCDHDDTDLIPSTDTPTDTEDPTETTPVDETVVDDVTEPVTTPETESETEVEAEPDAELGTELESETELKTETGAESDSRPDMDNALSRDTAGASNHQTFPATGTGGLHAERGIGLGLPMAIIALGLLSLAAALYVRSRDARGLR